MIIFFQSLLGANAISLETEFFVDKNNSYTLNNIIGMNVFKAQTTSQSNNALYSQDTLYLKTFIKNNSNQNLHKLVYFPRPSSGNIDVLVYHHKNNIIKKPKLEYAKNGYFIVSIEPNASCTIYASIKSKNLIEAKLLLIESTQFLQQNIIDTLIFSLYIGFMFFLIYSNTLNYLATKNNIFNTYTLYISSMLIFQILDSNFLLLLDHETFGNISDFTNTSVIVLIISVLYFHMEFFKLKYNNPNLYKFHQIMILANSVYLVPIFILVYRQDIINMDEIFINEFYILNILVTICLILYNYFSTLSKQIIGALHVVVGFIAMGLVMLAYILTDLYYTDFKFFIPLPLFGSMIEFIFISYALSKQIGHIYEKNQELDVILAKKSREANFGLMIDAISHQWKQPLNRLGMNILKLNVKLKYTNETPTKEFLLQFTEKSENILEFMSKTIDTFRNFFRTTQTEEIDDLSKSLENILMFFDETFQKDNIKIETEIEKSIFYKFKQEEFSHAILNILMNAKDALLQNEIEDPRIKIILSVADNNITLKIQDNGGGIKIEPIESIFELNISTNNNGIGLYITQLIIKKMRGSIKVENFGDGAVFVILFNKTQM